MKDWEDLYQSQRLRQLVLIQSLYNLIHDWREGNYDYDADDENQSFFSGYDDAVADCAEKLARVLEELT